MPEQAPARRAKEPSHTDILVQINGRFDLLDRRFDAVEDRLARGEKRFDSLEETMKEAGKAREQMALSLAAIQATQVAAEANNKPPWWLSWKPVAVGLSLAAVAGAGMTAITLAQLDIVPKLTAIKDAVQP